MDDKQVVKVFSNLEDWYNNIIANLKQVAYSNDCNIKLESPSGDKAKIIDKKSELAKGIRLGMQIAIETIGEFPVKLEKNESKSTDE